MTTASLPSIPRRFPVPHCPTCGRRFDKGESDEQCPHCGWVYEGGGIVLLGWGLGGKADLSNVPLRRVWLHALSTGVWYYFAWQAERSGRLWLAIGMLLLWALFLGPPLFRRIRHYAFMWPPVKVFLCPEGFCQHDGLGPVTLVPWTDDMDVTVSRRYGRRYQLLVERPRRAMRLHTPLVEFEFLSTEEEAEHLRKAIGRMRGA